MLTALRITASFAIVGVMLWAFARASSGRLGALLRGNRGGESTPLVVLDRRQLGRNTSVALIRSGERHLLVGVSDNRVELLAQGDDLWLEEDDQEIDENDGDPPSAEAGPTGPLVQDHRGARTRLPWAQQPRSARMSVLDALREKTVRQS
ncbi:MAG: flagellar biogenesis protein FliO [Acidimicrobiales bacterium]|jgi:flagellar biogenesis protein FliO